MSTTSLILFFVGLAILLIGLAVPGRDTATLPKRAVKRRIYWIATVAALPFLFMAGQPDLQSSVAFVAMALVLMIGWAYSRTPNLKIGDRIYSADPAYREPDPPRIP